MIIALENQLPIKIADQFIVRYINDSDKEDLFKIYSNENVSKLQDLYKMKIKGEYDGGEL